MQVDIYMPRLDVMFKEGPVPEQRGPIAPIRVHWIKFIEQLYNAHDVLKDDVRVIEVPLWQITTEFVKEHSKDADVYYIPHKMEQTWWLDNRVRYYMQMVIPHIFSIDSKGWCATASSYPMENLSKNTERHHLFDRVDSGETKFDQPSSNDTALSFKPYVFFPCQIPHDETIIYHSDVKVEEALEMTLDWASTTAKKVVIKGHPVNPGSMESIKKVANRYNCVWVDNFNIFDLIKNSEMVVTVNSGVGLESILAGKKVVTFGRADYDTVTWKVNPKEYRDSLSNAYNTDWINFERYNKFIHTWYETHYDYTNPESFKKIKNFC